MTYYDITDGTEIRDHEIEDRYRDALDECYPVATIAGMEYTTSRALAEVDPIAYRCGLADYESAEIGETIVERGFWVRVITADGDEVDGFTEWYADDEDAARQAAADFATVGLDGAPAGEYFVQAYDTDEDVMSEIRVIVD